jgi:hypothetical protein
MRVASPASEMWYGEDLEGGNWIDEALSRIIDSWDSWRIHPFFFDFRVVSTLLELDHDQSLPSVIWKFELKFTPGLGSCQRVTGL